MIQRLRLAGATAGANLLKGLDIDERFIAAFGLTLRVPERAPLVGAPPDVVEELALRDALGIVGDDQGEHRRLFAIDHAELAMATEQIGESLHRHGDEWQS